MTRTDALLATMKRFTNLIDGKVVPNAGVAAIIDYYESLLNDVTPVITMLSSGIIDNFKEEQAQEMLNEADYWDGDETTINNQ
jgi:hypothetical protein